MSFSRKLGLDILAQKYSYSEDPQFGHTSAQKIPDRWVPTTCGYCSVGCGMFIGVKDGRAVTVRGNPNHPVNLGKLSPRVYRSTTRSKRRTGRSTRC
jgi:ferredoxin-nitrate reductase